MKVGFHIGPLSSGHSVRGIGTNTKYLLEELKKISSLEIIEFHHLSELKGVDLIHYPSFDLFKRSLPLNFPIPTVVSVHDVIPLLFPKHYPLGIRARINLHWQKLALRKARAIITISRTSKEDIHQKLGIDLAKIYPIYLAASDGFRPIKDNVRLKRIAKKYNLPLKFGLFVGSVNWNKNILNLTQGVIDSKIDVVLVGKSFEQRENLEHPELSSYKQFLKKYGHHHKVHILPYVPTEDLAIIFNLATVTLLPSFYEGFGLTILESQASGTPVITSSTSSMPEVGGKGALYVDPYRAREITQAVNQLCDDISLRKKLISEGNLNVRKFSWRKTALDTARIYQMIANGR